MTRSKLFFLLGLSVLSLQPEAQIPGATWSMVIDGYNDVDVGGCDVDAEGNSYFGFQYTDDIDIPGLNKKFRQAPHVHSVLLKVSPSGKALWAMGITSANDNRIRDVHIAADGDVLITGFADGVGEFESAQKNVKHGKEKTPGEYHHPSGIFVARYSPQGEIRWVRFFSGSWGEGLSVATNSKGEVAVALYGSNTLSDESGETILPYTGSKGTHQHRAIVLLTADGTTREVRSLGYEKSSSAIIRIYVRFDHLDDLIVFGTFHNQIRLSPNDSIYLPDYTGGLDSFIARYDPDGKLIWRQHFGGQHTQWIRDLKIGPDNSIYFSGNYNTECVLLTNEVSSAGLDTRKEVGDNFFHGRIYADGTLDYVWFYQHPRGHYSVQAFQLGVDRYGELHFTGSFNDTIRLSGMELQAGYHNNQPFYAHWKGEELQELRQVGINTEHFIHAFDFALTDLQFCGAGSYYGNKAEFFLENKRVKLTSRDYGRATVIYGGSVPRKSVSEESEIAEQMARRNVQRYLIQSALTCLSEESPSSWISLVEPTLAEVPTPSQPPGIMAEPTLVEAEQPCLEALLDVQARIFPNPAREQVTLEISGMEGGQLQIELLDEMGRLLHSRAESNVGAEHAVSVNISALASGTYFFRIYTATHQKVLRLVVAT